MSEEHNAPVTKDEYRKWMAKRPSPREIARAELRDRFSMAALTGLLANANENHGHRRSSEGYAQTAYDIADAMLKARGDD